MNRRDWYLGRLHLIRRGYESHPQYGWLIWSSAYNAFTAWTLDVWFHRTLWTVRWNRVW